MTKGNSNGENGQTSGGVFVMYNCARLAMLLSNFEKHVNEGTHLYLYCRNLT